MAAPMDNDPLATLIHKAEGEVAHRVRSVTTKKSDPKSFPLATVLLMAVAAASVFGAWHMFAPPTLDTVERDLSKVVSDARDTVESAKANSGRLPDALPNAALSAMVQYEHDASDYTLSASMLGLRVTIGRDGNKSVEKGVK